MSVGTIAAAGLGVLVVLMIGTMWYYRDEDDEGQLPDDPIRDRATTASGHTPPGATPAESDTVISDQTGPYDTGTLATPSPLSDVDESKRNWLVGQSPEVEDKSYHIGFRRLTAGRKPSNFIQIPGNEASRTHLQLNGSREGLKVIDMSSANGTFVNGEELPPSASHTLKDGDRIRAGGVEYIYRQEGDYSENSALNEERMAGQAQKKATQAAGSIERQLEEALEKTNGDIEAAAKLLKIDPDIARKLREMSD